MAVPTGLTEVHSGQIRASGRHPHHGGGGHFVVAYGEEDGRVLVDDRNLAPLTVDRKTFDLARDRVGSDKNLLATIQPGEVPDWRAAVRGGLADCARNLSSPSKSFSLSAWERWAKGMTDERDPKGLAACVQ
jgi:hypothetical protein